MATNFLMSWRRAAGAAFVAAVLGWWAFSTPSFGTQRVLTAADTYVVNDEHLHLTNYVQEGTNIHDLLRIMGNKVGRAALFGIPLQQQWSYGNTGSFRADVLPANGCAAVLLLVRRRRDRDGLQVAHA